MRYLAAAAAAASAAASAAADRRSVDKAVAAAAAFSAAGTALQDVVVTQAGNVDLGQQIRQAAEQNWSLSNALSDQVKNPAILILPLPGSNSTLPVSQPPMDKLNEPETTAWTKLCWIMLKGVWRSSQKEVTAMNSLTQCQ